MSSVATAAPAEPMTLERAKEIVGAMVAQFYYGEGISEKEPAPIAEYSLRDMLEAKTVVEAENERTEGQPGTRTVYVIPDDRLIAALYVLNHYPADDPEDRQLNVIASNRRAGVIVIQIREAPDAED